MSTINVELVPVSDLRPYERNARRHTEADINAIAKSIKQFGFSDPIGIWGDNIIVEGHGRLEAAKQLHLQSVPCIRLDHMTDEQRRAYALAHNKTAELSEWDEERLRMELENIHEIDMEELGFDLSDSEIPDIDGLFEDAEPREKEPKRHICPHCGALVEV